MKASYYNFIYPLPGDGKQKVVYNSRTNAMALLDELEAEYLQGNETAITSLNDSTIREMKENGFLVGNDVVEIELIRENMFRCRYSDRQLGLTIAPTLDCNFRCIYCYEKECEKGVVMSQDTCNKLVDFVQQYAKSIDGLTITWYGGEPLLAIGVIENLTKDFKRICEDNDVSYCASIVTNGFLLDEKMLERLVACDVSFCQITLDGNRDSHNTRRPHISGQNTFDTIIENAKRAATQIDIAVRVNIDKTNMDAIYDVDKVINENNTHRIAVYPAPVQNEDGCYLESKCLGNEEFYKYKQSFFFVGNDIQLVMSQYPRLVGNSCCADNRLSFVISPNGDLYKCWTDIGKKEYCVGNIIAGEFSEYNSIRYSIYDATRDERCVKCKYLPICMGGCPHDVIGKKEDRCLHAEEVHKELLLRVAELLGA